MKFAHEQSQTISPQYQCTHQVWWKSIDVYSSYHPETKNGRTDYQRNTIIPRHYYVAGYKKKKKKKKKKRICKNKIIHSTPNSVFTYISIEIH